MPEPVTTLDTRRRLLVSLGASDAVATELLQRNAGTWACVPALPLRFDDEPFVPAWRLYADQVQAARSILPLSQYLVQLAFPVEHGMSNRDDYISATKKGIPPHTLQHATGLRWQAPDRVHVFIHPSLTGDIPVILAEEREDFVSLVRALTRSNEPAEVPTSKGASMIAGYRNWHRRASALRSSVGQPDAYGQPDAGDRFILLSSGDYSAVQARDLGLPSDVWAALSLRIRLEHECIHYATKRLFGSMRNSLFDELLADSFALFRATGEVRQEWLLHFLGLENSSRYRSGGRLENYRGTLSHAAFLVLQPLVRQAAKQLSSLFSLLAPRLTATASSIALLCAFGDLTLEDLAHPHTPSLLADRYNDIVAHNLSHPPLIALHTSSNEAHL